MIIYGKRNLRELMNALTITNVAVKATKYLFLPIYKVHITIDE